MIAMVNHRPEPSDDFPALLGPASALDRRAHYCDRNRDDNPLTKCQSSKTLASAVNKPVLARETANYPQNFHALHRVTTEESEVLTQLIPLPSPEYCDNEPDYDDEADKYTDPAWEYAQAYNDYCRECAA